jgi:hypothetical protein
MVGSAMTQTDGPCESCLPDGIEFTSQAQIDSFPINYPNCTEIEGTVLIAGSDITNLNGLNALTSIWGNLLIGRYFMYSDTCNPLLSSLAGLNNVTYVGGDLSIDCNYVLTSLAGLESLKSVGGSIKIQFNDSLSSMEGLHNITHLEELFIQCNNALTSLEGLHNLDSVAGGLLITYNDGLTSLSGLDNLTALGGILSIYDNNALTSLVGLHNINFLGGGLNIQDNDALTSLSGLTNITTVEGLWIQNNNALTNLEGLDNIISAGGDISIRFNDGLTSLAGIDNIDATTISSLYLSGNDLLSTCEVKSICDYLANPNGSIYLQDNATGCNSPEEVQDSCEAHAGIIDGLLSADKLIIYPNPTHATITIELPTQPSKNTTLTISNTNGQQLITQPINKSQTEIDISHLPTGIYIVKVWNDKEVMVQKVIKR